MVRQRYLPALPARSAHTHNARQAWMTSCNARPRPLTASTPPRLANDRAFLTQAHTIVKYDAFRAAKPTFLSFWADASIPQFHYSFHWTYIFSGFCRPCVDGGKAIGATVISSGAPGTSPLPTSSSIVVQPEEPVSSLP